MQQLAKNLESSKATACHIKQVAGNPQAMQINLLEHQCTELPAGKYKKKDHSGSPNKLTAKTRAVTTTNHKCSKRRSFIQRVHTKTEKDTPNAVTQSTWRGSNALLKSINAKLPINLGISPACAIKGNVHILNQEDLRCTNYKQVLYMHAAMHHMTTQMMKALPMTHSACK